MAYEIGEDTVLLVFEESQYEGLEVRCVAATMGDYLKYLGIDRIKNASELAVLLQSWGDDILVSWNMTKRGKPIAADGEGVKQAHMMTVLRAIGAWLRSIQEVPDPLDSPSKNGRSSAEPTKTASSSKSRRRSARQS